MQIYSFGNPNADKILFQAIDAQSLPSVDDEVRILCEQTAVPFCLMIVTVDDWFCDLSPWKSPAVFGNNAFGAGAARTLEFILGLCTDTGREHFIGGYSLSGLFALWAAYQTDTFKGVAAASPSIWFPGFTDYMKTHNICCNSVYLSLGDREHRTKNKVMASVNDCIRYAHDLLCAHKVNCTLEFNRGSHFTDVEKRCARAFARILDNTP